VPDKQQQIDMIGKVSVATCGMRRCLIEERVFTTMEVAEHSTTLCASAAAPVVSQFCTGRYFGHVLPCQVLVFLIRFD
jgi:hypothetical protein